MSEIAAQSADGGIDLWSAYTNDRRRIIASSMASSLRKLEWDIDTGNLFVEGSDPQKGISLMASATLVEGGRIEDPRVGEDFRTSEDSAMILAVGDFLAERGVIGPIADTLEAINE